MRIETGTPLLLTVDGDGVPMRRVSSSDRRVQEELIQDLIFSHPSLLPVAEIEPAFIPLIPIGREIPTTAGPIDALFIAPDGGLTIVEAKLWRNPEARREVVGQIVDYATALSRASYDSLDETCRNINGVGLWDLVSDAETGRSFETEAQFVDAVARGLRTGRFLLLVVGDGIREEVERIAAYVQAAPQLQFALALVELRIFEHPDGLRVVVPSVVARTAEVTRAVVHVDVAPEAKVQVSVAVPADDSPSARRKLTLDEFYTILSESTRSDLVGFVRQALQRFEEDPRFALSPGSASVSLHLSNPVGRGKFTVIVFSRDGSAYLAWLQQQCDRAGIPGGIALDFVADISRVVGIAVSPTQPDALERTIPLSVLEERWSEVEARIDRFADEVHRALNDIDEEPAIAE